MENTFTGIIEKEKEDELIPFLKTLSATDRKKLARFIKATKKELVEYRNGKVIRNYTEKQWRVLSIAAFVCMDMRMYNQVMPCPTSWGGGFVPYDSHTEPHLRGNGILDSILEWYCPEWLSDFLNDKRKNEEFRAARYEDMLRWEEKGYIKMSPELIAETLSHTYYESYYPEMQNNIDFRYLPEKLLENPITLEKHIWYIFQHPFTINPYVLPEENSLRSLLLDFVEKGHIDRTRLLKACLQTVNYSFNRTYIRWFTDLFNDLKPTKEELLSIQDDLLLVLQQGEDKLLTKTLEYIKTICTEPEFQTYLFTDNAPVLLTSPLKIVINHTLEIIEKVVNTHPVDTKGLCPDICNIFLQKDEKLQKRAFRFLQTHSDPESISSILKEYTGGFHPGIRPVIENWLGETKKETVKKPVIKEKDASIPIITSLTRDDNRIPEINTFDDFIYFASQAFKPGEPWRCSMLPEYISRFSDHMTVDKLSQFEPVIRNGYKLCVDLWTNNASYINRLYYSFLTDWLKLELKKFPKAPQQIKTLLQESTLSNEKTGRSEILLQHFILEEVNELLKKGEPVELLSTPTHAPLWIAPAILVQRIKRYQEKGLIPITADLQLAIMRCDRNFTKETVPIVKKELQGELKELFLFLFREKENPEASPEHPAWWLTAALTRDPYHFPEQAEGWGYTNIPEKYQRNRYNWQIKVKTHPILGDSKILDYDHPRYRPEINNTVSAYELIWGRTLDSYKPRDIYHLIFSSPYNHEKLLVELLGMGMDFKTFYSDLKAKMLEALNALDDLHIPFSPMDYQFMAFCIVGPDREVRNQAAGVWIKAGNNPGQFNNVQLGAELSTIVASEWLPLKRFSDIVSQNLCNISPEHNTQLITLISSFIESLDTPVKGAKPLLDTYYELLQSTHEVLSDNVNLQLNKWKQHTPGLKKQIERILTVER